MRTALLLPAILLAACGGTTEAPVVPPVDEETMRDRRVGVAAPASPAEGRFTLVRGADPIAVEDFRRTAGGFEADLQPSGGQPGLSYEARVTSGAFIDSLTVEMAQPGGAPQRLVLVLEETGDSAVVRYTQWQGDSAVQRSVGTKSGAVFYLNPSPSMMEQIVRRARAIGGDSVMVALFMPIGPGRTAEAAVTFPHPDSAVTDVGGTAVRMHIDAEGRLLGAAVPSQQLTIEREDAAR